ncbi:MAG: hypothetical protein ACTSRA_21640, partial [Promethearchaeota archaeon]
FIYTAIILYYPLLLIWGILRHLDPKYLYCRFRHGKPITYKYYKLFPFGMGGGYNIYYYICPKCKRKHWELTAGEFKILNK